MCLLRLQRAMAVSAVTTSMADICTATRGTAPPKLLMLRAGQEGSRETLGGICRGLEWRWGAAVWGRWAVGARVGWMGEDLGVL